MIASVLRLNRTQLKAEKITDLYSLHRVVYDLFEDVRSEEEKRAGRNSGILFVDKGGDVRYRQILILSDRPPKPPTHGELESKPIPEDFLDHNQYRFEILVNPVTRDSSSRRLMPVKGREAIAQWFMEKSLKSHGFAVDKQTLQVNKMAVHSFEKKGDQVTLNSASIQGYLTVTNREQFTHSFQQGVGRGRAFGLGLLQIVPTNNPFNI